MWVLLIERNGSIFLMPNMFFVILCCSFVVFEAQRAFLVLRNPHPKICPLCVGFIHTSFMPVVLEYSTESYFIDRDWQWVVNCSGLVVHACLDCDPGLRKNSDVVLY
jgi:hypothetical protein